MARFAFTTHASLVGVAACAAAALLPAASSAQTAHAASRSAAPAKVCRQWNIAGSWRSGQTNDNEVTYDFTQHGTTVGGKAHAAAGTAEAAGFGTGTISGKLSGDTLTYVVTWQRSTHDQLVHRGQYRGDVSRSRIRGKARDLTVMGPLVGFSATGKARCVSYEK